MAGIVEAPLTVFAGINLELDPTDLPQGLSPDVFDCAFVPGSVFTRPPLQRASTLGTTAQIIYAFSYRKPNGTVVQIQCDSQGAIYADGKQIGQTAAGNRFYALNAFGRAYIAISDGLHGQDIPLQLDANGNLDRVTQDGPGAPPAVANYGLPITSIASLTRNGNVVTVQTSGSNNLLPGYTATIQGVTDQSIGGGVSKVVIDNTNLPGLATVTLNSPHGLIPGQYITLTGVQNTVVGGGIASINTANGLATLTTQTANGLQAGANVYIVNSAGNTGQNTVSSVVTATEFQYAASGTYSQNSGGSVTLIWPDNASTGSQTYQIQTVPSATSFTIPLGYSSGTWTGGTVTFAWDGSFVVTSMPSPTSFTYNQTGPNGTANGGTVTPTGQIAPGQRQCVVIFQTRQGALTAPSPPVTFTASGGQYLQITNIPIGPPNVASRILAFTGANGANFFYLPTQPQAQGQVIGTSTVIANNTDTTAVFDFADPTLFSGLGIDIPGNNLFNQVALDGALSFAEYKGRLLALGTRNRINQFLNMGFEGGVISSAPNNPLGWMLTGGGSLVPISTGYAWTLTQNSNLSQPAYQDRYGVPILQPQTQYTFRAWINGTVTAQFVSASAGTLATATLAGSGTFTEATFSAKTPASVPSDTQLVLSGSGTVDELSIIYTANPYELAVRASYVNNPEGFDGETGILGPDDQHFVMGALERRDVLCLLTSGPDGCLYETSDSLSGEPSTWDIRRVASKCGLLSCWGIALFEDWFCWASDTGLRIFDGSNVEKMSQEIQSWWDSFNPLASQFTVCANDPYTRRIYVLAAITGQGTPRSMFVLDYRELNTSSALSTAGTLRVGYSGKVVTTDLTRKWCPWSLLTNYFSLIVQPNGESTMTFCGGNGGTLADVGTSTTYTLLEGSLKGIDDDYGPFWNTSYYTTYFFLDPNDAQQKQLSTHRLLHKRLTMNVQGNGSIIAQSMLNRLGNVGRATPAVSVTTDIARDLEFNLNEAAERVAYRISCQPQGPQPATATAQAGFRMSELVVGMSVHPYSPMRGRNG